MPTKTSGLDVVAESAVTSVYNASTNSPATATLSLTSYDEVLEGGSHVLWTYPLSSPDQSPLFVLDLLWDEGFLYFSARYQSLEEMSFEVDLVAEKYLDHAACTYEDSCNNTALLIKTRLDNP